jgi:hypothetical protein
VNQHTQIQTKPETPSFSPSPPLAARTTLLQRKCACGGTPGLDGECAECRRKRLLGSQRNLVDQAEVPPIVDEVLRSQGRPLDAYTRASTEASVGHDFSKVRIHTDPKAAESARAVNALAYTVGQDIAFGAGQYAPERTEGRQLIAHELTHVVQQARGVWKPQPRRSTVDSSKRQNTQVQAWIRTASESR